jgi:hypothetical protein
MNEPHCYVIRTLRVVSFILTLKLIRVFALATALDFTVIIWGKMNSKEYFIVTVYAEISYHLP